MPDENPYAAPQTVDSQQPAAAMPLAGAHGQPTPERRLAGWDNARLFALWKHSRAIQDLQGGWLVMCLATPIFGFFFALSFALYDFYFDQTRGILALCAVALTFARFGTGFTRTQISRVFALVMDALLGLGCAALLVVVIGIVFTEPVAALVIMFVLPFTTLIGFQAVRSIRAMLEAPELFGPGRVSHEALCDEVEYRREHQNA